MSHVNNGAKSFSKPGLVIARTPLIEFEGRVVPKEVTILSNGKQVLKASLTRITKMDKIDEARFVPLPMPNSSRPR